MIRDFDTLKLSIDKGLATIALSRPDRGNALDAQAGRDLRAVALQCMSSSSVRAVLLKAEGKNFCVGGDLRDFLTHQDLPGAVKDMTVDFHAAVTMFARMGAPLIAAVNGAAAGAGLTLAAVSDYVLAGRSSTFTYAYSGVGFTSDGGLTWLLPRLIGLRRFQAMVLEGATLSAEPAREVGIVSRVVDDETLEAEAVAFARRVAEGPTRAYAGIKRLALTSFSHAYEVHLEDEAQALFDVAGTQDAQGAIRAVASRQRPLFTGS
jgi:2-(1,2-epoxy-1,2-dihydrophenyl)acetyl-CoA isomerase